MRPIVSFDLDGTIVDFIHGFTTLANQHYGIPILSGSQQSDWNLDVAFGLSENQSSHIWGNIIEDRRFWAELPLMVTQVEMDRIVRMSEEFDTYFVTMRTGLAVKDQSEEWLRSCGIKNPSVIVSRGGRVKGLISKAIGATHFLEDNVEVVQAILEQSPGTDAALIERPYNRYGRDFGLRFVKTVDSFLDDVYASVESQSVES